MYCQFCGDVDEYYDGHEEINHENTAKHLCNVMLYEYKEKKKYFSKNREGIYIYCKAKKFEPNGKCTVEQEQTDHYKIRIYVKPMVAAKFVFEIKNDMKNEDLVVVGMHAGHPQPQFMMNDHPYVFGAEPHILPRKSTLPKEVSVSFVAGDIGQYEMPIMFTFHRKSTNRDLIFIRELVVMVEESPIENKFNKSPYLNKDWPGSDHFVHATCDRPLYSFEIPKLLKILLPLGLDEKALEKIRQPSEIKEQLRMLLVQTRAIFDEGVTKNNYMAYMHHLLWWEEIIAKINLRKYNMTDVTLLKKQHLYRLLVPGLAEKRPSLLRGDKVYLLSKENSNTTFEGVIKNIEDDFILIGDLNQSFHSEYKADNVYEVRFSTSRGPYERCHEATSRVFAIKQACRIFPQERRHRAPLIRITKYSHNHMNGGGDGMTYDVRDLFDRSSKFYNEQIKNNKEQRSAVEHIVSGTSEKAPYIVFGPPGTGKTLTIVEAIIQLVVRNPKNRILVCTDSNMAADHIAMMLMKYTKVLNINKYLLRANSQMREWSVMPAELAEVSNGRSFETFYSVSNAQMSSYRITVTTLLHAAKYGSFQNQMHHKLQMSHLFIDEAAQASEPAALVPICSLLASTGQLVLAGDPKQLGPVCISRTAKQLGLGTSLMERLLLSYTNLYENNSDYMTLLVKNFRSDPEILKLPNDLFYGNQLEALAPPDPLSRTSILGLEGGNHAVVFHGVHSREQKMGKSPSYYNEKELEMLKRYIKKLVGDCAVLPEDIGVIAPYIRQVYKIKSWLGDNDLQKVETGTVEAFQGKEKRVILVSTVRANCRLLEYDAKYGLGFLVDDKRFNVTITRAKAKIIIIGNPACLCRDEKWRRYISLCEEYETYHGKENQQLERTTELLMEIANTRLEKCRIKQAIKEFNDEKKKGKK